jgi:hypothetical protein
VPTPGLLHQGVCEGVVSAVKWTYNPPSARHLVARGSALGTCGDGACMVNAGLTMWCYIAPGYVGGPGPGLPVWYCHCGLDVSPGNVEDDR